MHLFAQHGYHGVSVYEIVKHSKTSKGGFYHHFKSKDELLYVIHDYFISYVLRNAETVIASTVTPTVKLHHIIQSFVKVFDLYKPHLSVFYQESIYLKSPYVERIKEKRNRYRNIIYQVLEEGMSKGEFRMELPVTITAMSILGIVNWMYKWYKKDGSFSIEQIAHIYGDFIFQAIWTEEAKQHPAYQTYRLKQKQDMYVCPKQTD